MPSVSSQQAHVMQMSLSPEGRKKLRQYGIKPVDAKVAREFVDADKRKRRRHHKGSLLKHAA